MGAIRTAVVLTLASLTLAAHSAHAAAESRSQVKAELQEAKATGEYSFGENDYPRTIGGGPTLKRAQVRAELLQAKASGQVTTEELDYPPMATAAAFAQSGVQLAMIKLDGQVDSDDDELLFLDS